MSDAKDARDTEQVSAVVEYAHTLALIAELYGISRDAYWLEKGWVPAARKVEGGYV